MADDGSGADISIPSFLMFKVDAGQIKAQVRANHPVQIEMQWSQKRNERVEYELWTTPSDPFSKVFQKRFKPFAEALGDRAYFTPHLYIYDGKSVTVRAILGRTHVSTCARTMEGIVRLTLTMSLKVAFLEQMLSRKV